MPRGLSALILGSCCVRFYTMKHYLITIFCTLDTSTSGSSWCLEMYYNQGNICSVKYESAIPDPFCKCQLLDPFKTHYIPEAVKSKHHE